ncbi:Uncharacterised protein [Escherichia coli]|uniref:Uncharacterized protein n=1 Tax=Escherichia coli TaxID=562 RepID=A0A377DNY6_ECOLX|nr:Uncharacterised protein [Escherichia coli]
MPHSLFSTDTDLTAEKSAAFCPLNLAARCGSTMRKLFVGRLQR